jgi:hypothetical protein
MQFPVTRYQLIAAVETFGFRPTDAQQIVTALEAEGRIELSGSMLHIEHPDDPDAPAIAGLCREARGASAGSAGHYKIQEYLQHTLAHASQHGSSRRT